MPEDLPQVRRYYFAVNRGSGTVRSLGEAAVRTAIEQGVQGLGSVEIAMLDGNDLLPAIDAAISTDLHDVIVVGGGDGSLSAAAGLLVGQKIALAILPLGTMNLLAKSIGLDMNLTEAIRQISVGEVAEIDVGRVNGRVFLHQVSFGLQPRVVKIREKIGYRSRITKMLSGAVALVNVLSRPRTIRMVAEIDGSFSKVKLPALVVSNNLYRDDRPAIPRSLEESVLGVYMIAASRPRDFVRLTLAALAGTWKNDAMVDAQRARNVRLRLVHQRGKGKLLASVDGELVYLSSPIRIDIQPLALRMVMPQHGAGR